MEVRDRCRSGGDKVVGSEWKSYEDKAVSQEGSGLCRAPGYAGERRLKQAFRGYPALQW